MSESDPLAMARAECAVDGHVPLEVVTFGGPVVLESCKRCGARIDLPKPFFERCDDIDKLIAEGEAD